MNSKIQLIAKLSGSFTFCAAASQIQKETEFGVSNVSDLLLPSTARALSLFGSSGIKTAERLRPFRAQGDNGQQVKIYPTALLVAPLSSQFTFFSLRTAVLRGAMFTYFPLFEQHFRAITEAEAKAEERGEEFEFRDIPEFPWEAARQKVPFAILNTVKELCVGIVRVLLNWASVAYLDDRLAWKLIKDQKSSVRAKRVLPFWKRPYVVARTVVRGSVIPILAELLVSCLLEAIKTSTTRTSLSAKCKHVARTTTALGVRAVINLVAGAAGAGLLATIRPGFLSTTANVGTVFLLDTFIVVPAVTRFINGGRLSREIKLLFTVSGGIVVVCFLPWTDVFGIQTVERPALAVALQ